MLEKQFGGGGFWRRSKLKCRLSGHLINEEFVFAENRFRQSPIKSCKAEMLSRNPFLPNFLRAFLNPPNEDHIRTLRVLEELLF